MHGSLPVFIIGGNMKKTKLPARFWVALTLFSFIGQVAWVVENMYFNVFIYKMFRADAGDISLMVAASAVAATVTTLIIGALSDKLGKRRIFIAGGYILWGISILSFALIRTDIIEKIVPATASAASVVRRTPVLYATLAAFAVFGISIQIFMPYLILYYSVTLGIDNYVLVMAPAIIIAAAVTLATGKCYDRFGFRATVIPALAALAAGYAVLYFCRAVVPVFVGSLLMMSGYLAGAAVFGAMLRDNTPPRRAGMFQGLRIVGQVLIPGMIGPAIGAAVLRGAEKVVGDDGTASFVPNHNIFLAALVAAVLILPLIAWVSALVKKGSAAEVTENGKA